MGSGAAGRRGGGGQVATASHQSGGRGPPLGDSRASLPAEGTRPAAPLPRWHLWADETPRPGWANMAIDHALLERAERQGESWLRLYQWMPHCLSFGRHEPASRRYDVDRIRALGLDTVRRPSGGRAVWHARELTYAVAAPSRQFGSLRAAYIEIHSMLAEALRALGAPVLLAASAPASSLDAGACFAHTAGGELMAAGGKVVGSAQYRQGAALLQHGSILLENDQRVVLSLTKRSGEILANVSERLPGGLTSVVGRPLQSLDVAGAITRAAERRWSGTWTRIPAPGHLLEAASRHYQHYRSSAWTWTK